MNTGKTKRQRIQNFLLILLPILIAASFLFKSISSGKRKLQETPHDSTPPVIHLIRDERYFVYPGQQYEEEGYSAYDDTDGDITADVEVSVNRDTVRYKVRDRAGNIAVRFRRIPFAEEPVK